MLEKPVRRLRKALEQTQEQFGFALGVAQSRVSEVEGDSPLDTKLALRIWELYGARLRGMGFSFERFVRESAVKPAADPPSQETASA